MSWCSLGWHRWGRWEEAVLKVYPQGRELYWRNYMAPGQKRTCERCGRVEGRIAE